MRKTIVLVVVMFSLTMMSNFVMGGTEALKKEADFETVAKILIPAKVYLAAGRELNLWQDTLWPSGGELVRITVKAAVGAQSERGWRFTPAKEQAGKTFPVTIEVRDRQDRPLDAKAFSLVVTPAQPEPGARQLLFIGDSLTAFYNGYPKTTETVSGVSTAVHSNAVHPNEAGLRQAADAYYSVLCGWAAETAPQPAPEEKTP